MSNEVASVANKAATMRDVIEKKWVDIQKALPQHVTPTRMLRVIQNMLGKNPKLLECTPQSVIGAITVASELGLEPNTPLGLGFILPYQQSKKDASGRWVKTMEAQFQIGYKGIIELAYRSGRVRSIAAECVYKNDTFKRVLGLHRDLVHEPATGDRGEIVGYYATVCVDGVDPHFEFISVTEAHDHGKKFSKAFQYDLQSGKQASPWSTNFDAMALKTVVLKALKFCPKAIEDPAMRKAVDHEEVDFAIDTTATPVVPDVPQFDLDQLEATPEQPDGFEKATADTSPQPIDVQAEPGLDTAAIEIQELRETIEAVIKEHGIPRKHVLAIIDGIKPGSKTLDDLSIEEGRLALTKVKEAA